MTKQITPAEFRRIRESLGYSQEGLARMWNMGKGCGRTIRRWELGECAIPGPVSFAIQAMEAGYNPGKET